MKGPAVTESWSKPQEVDAQPLANLTLQKASSGGRKRKSWVRDGITRYDSREQSDRAVDPVALKQLRAGLCQSIGDWFSAFFL